MGTIVTVIGIEKWPEAGGLCISCDARAAGWTGPRYHQKRR